MAKLADLLDVDEARSRILARFTRLGTEQIALDAALRRVLAEPIISGMDVPPFANSSMDGFALRSSDVDGSSTERPVALRVVERIAAGSRGVGRITPGTCARIMTGAPLPAGADAVVPFEEVEEHAEVIDVYSPISPGACVRPSGNDLRRGAVVLEAGSILLAPQIALLAALGHASFLVTRKPIVAVLSTGDELVSPGQPLSPGQIYNSNTPMLTAAITEAGADAHPIASAADDPLSIATGVEAAAGCDLLLTSGGASVGDFDHVKDVVGAEGEVGFWRVRIRPGKPLLFGSVGDLPVIGLPGNPTSAMVTFEEFVRPAIEAMLGAPLLRPEITAILDDRIDNRGGRRTYARVILYRKEGQFHASLAGPQDSAMVRPLARADGLLVVSEDCEEMLPGTVATVQVWRLPT